MNKNMSDYQIVQSADAYLLRAFSAHEKTALDGHTGSSSSVASLHTPQRSRRFSESSFRSQPTL